MRSTSTYTGGIDAILTRFEFRRDRIGFAPGEALAALDTDLEALAARTVTDPSANPDIAPPFRSFHHRKTFAMQEEFIGNSELCSLHGLVISHLRKREWPDHAPALFQRLWAEQGNHLLTRLDARWLVSAVTTFGDHGVNAAQRATGLGMTVLFGAMKLYESERLYSGHKPDSTFALNERKRASLPMDMDAYALASGDVDIHLIARLWREAEADPVIAPLAHRLLTLLIHDDRTVFRRLITMRGRKAKKEKTKALSKSNIAPVTAAPLSPETLRWGVVSTIKAPLPEIARFAAHHLDLGASEIHIHLDTPDPEAEGLLARNPKVHVIQCDDAYWAAQEKPRMKGHEMRQVHNATRVLRACAGTLDLLAHIDVDEFLLPQAPLNHILAGMSRSAAYARIHPAEALAREDGPPQAFKLTHKGAGQRKIVLQDVYPTFGLHLYGGFLSHSSGKVFARPGIPDTRLGIHTLRYAGEEASNVVTLSDVHLAHLHAPNWQHFLDHLPHRLTEGSYRKRERKTEMGQGELLRFLAEEDGEAGLRALFDEVCADTPELRARLASRNMLIEADLDLDAKVQKYFGDLP